MPVSRSTRFSSSHFSVFRTVPYLSLQFFVRQFGWSCQYTPFILTAPCCLVDSVLCCGANVGVWHRLCCSWAAEGCAWSRTQSLQGSPKIVAADWETVLEYSGHSAFKSRFGHQLSWGLPWGFSVLPGKCRYTVVAWAVVAYSASRPVFSTYPNSTLCSFWD